MPDFQRLIKHPFYFRVYQLKNLPAAFFCGVRVVKYDENSCTTSIRYSWFTRNPFRSTYFAALAMAAELSTGALAMGNVYKQKPAISMLLTGQEAQYLKKATGITWFHCEAGKSIAACIEKARMNDAPQQISVATTGKNAAGETIAVFTFQWSFKKKKSTI